MEEKDFDEEFGKILEELYEQSASYCYDIYYGEEKELREMREVYEKIFDMAMGEEQAEAKRKFWEGFKKVVREHVSVDVATDERAANIVAMNFYPIFDIELVLHKTKREIEEGLIEQRKFRRHQLENMYPECFEGAVEKKDEKEEKLKYMLEYVKKDFESEGDYELTLELLQLSMKKDYEAGPKYIIPKQKNMRRITYIIFRIAKEKLLFGGRYERRERLVPFFKNYFVNYKMETDDYIDKHLSDDPLKMKEDFDQYLSDFSK